MNVNMPNIHADQIYYFIAFLSVCLVQIHNSACSIQIVDKYTELFIWHSLHRMLMSEPNFCAKYTEGVHVQLFSES